MPTNQLLKKNLQMQRSLRNNSRRTEMPNPKKNRLHLSTRSNKMTPLKKMAGKKENSKKKMQQKIKKNEVKLNLTG